MKMVKRLLCLLCALCLSLNVLVAGAEDEHIDAGEMTTINRKPILILSVGTGEGQVAYGGNYMYGYTGPEAFAVEDDTVYILDNNNKRIVLWENGEFSNFDISDCPWAQHMTYQNGKIGVIDTIANVTGIYSVDGTKLTLISHSLFQTFNYQFPVGIAEIGDSCLIWKTSEDNYYRYDWESNSLEVVDKPLTLEISDAGITKVTDKMSNDEWTINSENKIFETHKVIEGELVYSQYEMIPDVDYFAAELSIRKIDKRGNETYSIINTEDWYVNPVHPLYVSSEGKVYLMDCFENRIVISEVILGTSDVSKMDELYAETAERRAEILREREALDLNAQEGAVAKVVRQQAINSAKAMVNLQWIVTSAIGVDCPGFAASAYKMPDASKIGPCT